MLLASMNVVLSILATSEGVAGLAKGPCGGAAANGMVKSDAPNPELEDIPQQVLSGLIRNLRVRMT